MITKRSLADNLMMAKMERLNTVEFKTSFGFLLQINGFRRGNVHIIMGGAGTGKSTLTRSVILDFVKNNPTKKVGVWLSEETTSSYELELFRATWRTDSISNVHIEHEFGGNYGEIKNKFIEFTKNDFDIIFYDNLTTSMLYEPVGIDGQMEFANKLKEIAQEKDVPLVALVHTGSGAGRNTDRLLEGNDVRGSKIINNMAEFFFILQTFNVNDKLMSMLMIDKSRSQLVKDKIFMLNFKFEDRIFVSDNPVPFLSFKELFKGRDKL